MITSLLRYLPFFLLLTNSFQFGSQAPHDDKVAQGGLLNKAADAVTNALTRTIDEAFTPKADLLAEKKRKQEVALQRQIQCILDAQKGRKIVLHDKREWEVQEVADSKIAADKKYKKSVTYFRPTTLWGSVLWTNQRTETLEGTLNSQMVQSSNFTDTPQITVFSSPKKYTNLGIAAIAGTAAAGGILLWKLFR